MVRLISMLCIILLLNSCGKKEANKNDKENSIRNKYSSFFLKDDSSNKSIIDLKLTDSVYMDKERVRHYNPYFFIFQFKCGAEIPGEYLEVFTPNKFKKKEHNRRFMVRYSEEQKCYTLCLDFFEKNKLNLKKGGVNPANKKCFCINVLSYCPNAYNEVKQWIPEYKHK